MRKIVLALALLGAILTGVSVSTNVHHDDGAAFSVR
jgi:hypothetical protein